MTQHPHPSPALGDRTTNEAVFDRLLAEKDAIEREFGEALRWERLDGRRACRIAAYSTGSIEDPAEQWEQHRKWAIDRLLRFKKVGLREVVWVNGGDRAESD